MKNYLFICSWSFIIYCLFTMVSCSDDNESPVNQAPTCNLTNPEEGDRFVKGDTIEIQIVAADPDGEIDQVHLFFNDIGKTTLDDDPFVFSWLTKEETGDFCIKAIAYDYTGNSAEEQVNITVMSHEFDSFIDTRDGKEYKTVKIGNQWWMAENLQYPNINRGDFDSSYLKIFGLVYSYEGACNSCPDGWHLPTTEEWRELIDFLGGDSIAGGKMKSEKHWRTPNKGADNESGFSALPGGAYFTPNPTFGYIGLSAFFWSQSNFIELTHDDRAILIKPSKKTSFHAFYSVRCIKD